MRKSHMGSSTHKHSKVVAKRSGGYPSLNRRMGAKSQNVSRPDVTYSTGHGRQNPGNATVKNCA